MSKSRRSPSPLLTLCVLAGCLNAQAEDRPFHGLYRGGDPPGVVGRRQLTRGQRFAGKSQIVELRRPEGTGLAVAEGGGFVNAPGPRTHFCLNVGSVYRFRIDDVPGFDGSELFPSIELMDSTSPPPGREHAFPLVIEFTEEDLRAALRGAFIVRVVGVEDPSRPGSDGVASPTVDVIAGEDPLRTADRMGRPIAIVRIGSILPTSDPPEATFCFGYPPIRMLSAGEDFDLRDPAMSGAACSCLHCRWRARPDEVICDGGDDGPRARVARTDPLGLAPTETVAAFRTLDGSQHHTASNRVCLYSPRFYATRQVWPLTQHERVQSVGGIHKDFGVVAESAPLRSQLVDDRQQAHSQEVARLRHAVESRSPGLLLDNIGYLEEVSDQNLPWQNRQAIGRESTIQTDRVQISTTPQPAITWSLALAAEVMLDDEVALEQRGLRAANEGVVYESPQGARLRLTKRVSRTDASAGDVVHFVIRFDNVGAEPLTEVVIADHLSPRLEFMADTAQCSCAAELETTFLDGGTVIARWRLSEMVPPQTGGTIEFDCLLR